MSPSEITRTLFVPRASVRDSYVPTADASPEPATLATTFHPGLPESVRPCPPAGSDWQHIYSAYFCAYQTNSGLPALTATPDAGYP